MEFEQVTVPQQFTIPPQMAAPVAAPKKLPGWVVTLAVIVSLLKMVPLLFLAVAAGLLGGALGGTEFGLVVGVILLIPAAITGIQMVMALTQRRLGLQITSGIFAAFDVLGVISTVNSSDAIFVLGVGLAVAQSAVFIGSLIDPSK